MTTLLYQPTTRLVYTNLYPRLIWIKVALSLALLAASFSALAFTIEQKPLKELVYFPKYEFAASIVAHTESEISSEIDARLMQLDVRPGQQISKNSVIARLDCRDTKDKLELNHHQQVEAKSKLKLAKLQLERFKNLESRQYTATSQIDESLSQVQSIEANIEGLRVEAMMAKRAIERCVIRAPYNAVVTKLFVGQGQWLSVGNPVVKLVRQDASEIEVNIPTYIADSLQGQSAMWKAKNRSQESVKWLRKSGVLESNQRMAKVWFVAPESQPIGMSGELTLKDTHPHISSKYVVVRNGLLGVFTVEEGKAKFLVLTNAQIGRPADIPDEWSDQMPIVTRGQQRLQDGQTVKDVQNAGAE